MCSKSHWSMRVLTSRLRTFLQPFSVKKSKHAWNQSSERSKPGKRPSMKIRNERKFANDNLFRAMSSLMPLTHILVLLSTCGSIEHEWIAMHFCAMTNSFKEIPRDLGQEWVVTQLANPNTSIVEQPRISEWEGEDDYMVFGSKFEVLHLFLSRWNVVHIGNKIHCIFFPFLAKLQFLLSSIDHRKIETSLFRGRCRKKRNWERKSGKGNRLFFYKPIFPQGLKANQGSDWVPSQPIDMMPEDLHFDCEPQVSNSINVKVEAR